MIAICTIRYRNYPTRPHSLLIHIGIGGAKGGIGCALIPLLPIRLYLFWTLTMARTEVHYRLASRKNHWHKLRWVLAWVKITEYALLLTHFILLLLPNLILPEAVTVTTSQWLDPLVKSMAHVLRYRFTNRCSFI